MSMTCTILQLGICQRSTYSTSYQVCRITGAILCNSTLGQWSSKVSGVFDFFLKSTLNSGAAQLSVAFLALIGKSDLMCSVYLSSYNLVPFWLPHRHGWHRTKFNFDPKCSECTSGSVDSQRDELNISWRQCISLNFMCVAARLHHPPSLLALPSAKLTFLRPSFISCYSFQRVSASRSFRSSPCLSAWLPTIKGPRLRDV